MTSKIKLIWSEIWAD